MDSICLCSRDTITFLLKFYFYFIETKKSQQKKPQHYIPYNTNINSRKTNTMKIFTKLKKSTSSNNNNDP